MLGMSQAVGRRQPSARSRLWLSLQAACILLACIVSPVRSARRSSVSDLESKQTGQRIGGRRLMMNDAEYKIIDEVGYDILEVLRKEYSPDIGCYGGYGLYGYYGYWSGVYGSYEGDLFVDYTFGVDGYTEIESDDDDWMERRMLAGGEDGDYDFELRPYPINITDAFTDYESVISGSYSFLYSGHGWGSYYGSVPLYASIYGGELIFDYEGAKARDELEDWIATLLHLETKKQAAEELEHNLKEGQWTEKSLLPPPQPPQQT